MAIVVVTYNRKELLKECIEALTNQSYKGFDLYVIDNASTDGTAEMIAAAFPQGTYKYYNTGDNLGGAGGFNFGLKVACKEKYDYYWLMDDDSIPDKCALEQIMHAAKTLNDQFGFLCSNIRWTDGSPCVMNIPRINEKWSTDCALIKNGIVPVDNATFVGFFLKHEIVQKIGLPIKEFFIWSDDTNYCMRIHKEHQCYCVLDSVIIHKMKSNTSSDIVSDNSGRYSRYYYSYRNKLYNAKYERKVGRYSLQLMKNTIQVITRSTHKREKLFYMYKGFFAGIIFNPEIERL